MRDVQSFSFYCDKSSRDFHCVLKNKPFKDFLHVVELLKRASSSNKESVIHAKAKRASEI